MGVYKKKTWTDSVIEAANRAETEEEKMIQGMLILVVYLRESPYLKMDRGPWFSPPKFDLTNKEGLKEYNEYCRANEIRHHLIKSLRSEYNQSLLFVWDHWEDKDKPQLKLVPHPDKQIFCDLVQNLQDPDWIAALRWCPECHNFILSVAKWANKFCSTKCKEKYHGRKNKKNRKKKREAIRWEQASKLLDTKEGVVERPEPRKNVMVGCRSCYYEHNLGSYKNVLEDPSLDMDYCPKCKASLDHWIRYSEDMEEAPLSITEWKKCIEKNREAFIDLVHKSQERRNNP